MRRAVLRLVPVGESDDPCLDDAERSLCQALGTPELRQAARVAAKRAAVELMGTGMLAEDVSIVRSPSGRPELGLRHAGATRDPEPQPLPSVTMSHAAGWGAALAWRT